MSVSEVHYRKFRQIDIKHFKEDICASELRNTTRSNVDEMADCYNKTLRSTLDKHAPIKSKFLITRQTVPWFNDKLKKLKAKRRKLERRMIKSGLQCDKDAYRKVRNDYCTSLNKTRRTYYTNMINECAGDSRKLFRIVNSLSENVQLEIY